MIYYDHTFHTEIQIRQTQKPRTINVTVRWRHSWKHSSQTLPCGLVLGRSNKAVEVTYVLPHVLTPAPVNLRYGDPDKEIMELKCHLVGLRCKTATQI